MGNVVGCWMAGFGGGDGSCLIDGVGVLLLLESIEAFDIFSSMSWTESCFGGRGGIGGGLLAPAVGKGGGGAAGGGPTGGLGGGAVDGGPLRDPLGEEEVTEELF